MEIVEIRSSRDVRTRIRTKVGLLPPQDPYLATGIQQSVITLSLDMIILKTNNKSHIVVKKTPITDLNRIFGCLENNSINI